MQLVRPPHQQVSHFEISNSFVDLSVLYTVGSWGREPACKIRNSEQQALLAKWCLILKILWEKSRWGWRLSYSCSQVTHASGKIRAVAIWCASGPLPVCFNSALMTTYHKLKTNKQAYGLLFFNVGIRRWLSGSLSCHREATKVRSKIIPTPSCISISLLCHPQMLTIKTGS